MGYKDIIKSIYSNKIVSPEDINPSAITPTPSPYVNWVLSGGIVGGRTYQLQGPPSGGKSMFTHAICSTLLRQDPESVVFWYDAEFSYSRHWHQVFMPDIPEDRIIVIRSNDGPFIFDHIKNEVARLVENEKEDKKLKVAAIVIDSLQSIIPPKISNRESSGDAQIAPLSGFLPYAFATILDLIRSNGIPLLVVSQVRANLDMSARFTHEKFGSNSSGYAWQHAIDVDIMFEPVEGKDSKMFDNSIKNANEKGIRTGHRVRMTNKKNKVSAPYRVAEFTLDYYKGIINIEDEIASLGLNLGVITQEGNTYYFEGQKLAVGAPKTLELIAGSPAIQQAIIKSIEGK